MPKGVVSVSTETHKSSILGGDVHKADVVFDDGTIAKGSSGEWWDNTLTTSKEIAISRAIENGNRE